eukprot:TRINITY_DN192_c5_g1_i1.p1 TRINITY_DN192_c5_g1~~TRINITY_DN192_c5_g1_i1.p1  ORF type:complete len:485 (+),score=69.17 TRINITY_DN192_c5_g1_i1:100-1554(+)
MAVVATGSKESLQLQEETEVQLTRLQSWILHRPGWWKKLVFIVAGYNLMLVPYRICLNVTDTESVIAFIILDSLADLIMWVEFACVMMTPPPGYGLEPVPHCRNGLINIRSKAAVAELCAVMPLDFVWFAVRGRVPYPVFRINKMIRVARLDMYFSELRKILQISHNASRVFQFTVLIFWMMHWLGCIWAFVVREDGDDILTWYWTQRPDLINEAPFAQYVVGVYWSLTMMTGYGSLLPQSDLQVIYSLITVLIGVSINVGVIGTLGSLIQNLDSSGAAFRRKMDAVNDYMRYRKLSPEMQRRIKDYYGYLWQSRRGLDEASLILELPEYLQQEVQLFLNEDIISKVPLFHECDEQFKSAVVVKLIPIVLLPDSYIVRKGEVGREMYFISRGEVHVVSEAKDPSERIVYATLRDGSFFGEVALLFNDSRRTATVITSLYCDLYVLRKEDFDSIQEQFPDQSKVIQKAATKRYKLQQENEAEADK